jgi:general secretion pathway protein N
VIVLTRRARWIIGVSAALVMGVISLPLAVVLPMALPADSGLSARRAEGPVWEGMLREANVAGLPLGDTRIGFDFLPLLVGQARLGFAAPALRGIVAISSNNVGLSRGNGTIDLSGRLRPLPLTRLTLDEVAVAFRNNRCASASGRIRADIASDIGGIALPGGMNGTLRCDGADLVVPLVGQSGMERIDLRVAATGSWRADLSVRTNDPAIAGKLLSSGFSSGPGGYTVRVSGAL